eukprot:6174078-Pleurochrysis_carterae.AAC.3
MDAIHDTHAINEIDETVFKCGSQTHVAARADAPEVLDLHERRGERARAKTRRRKHAAQRESRAKERRGWEGAARGGNRPGERAKEGG